MKKHITTRIKQLWHCVKTPLQVLYLGFFTMAAIYLLIILTQFLFFHQSPLAKKTRDSSTQLAFPDAKPYRVVWQNGVSFMLTAPKAQTVQQRAQTLVKAVPELYKKSSKIGFIQVSLLEELQPSNPRTPVINVASLTWFTSMKDSDHTSPSYKVNVSTMTLSHVMKAGLNWLYRRHPDRQWIPYWSFSQWQAGISMLAKHTYLSKGTIFASLQAIAFAPSKVCIVKHRHIDCSMNSVLLDSEIVPMKAIYHLCHKAQPTPYFESCHANNWLKYTEKLIQKNNRHRNDNRRNSNFN